VFFIVTDSVVDPDQDPEGSGTFCRIRIRNSRVSNPDLYPKIDVSINKNHKISAILGNLKSYLVTKKVGSDIGKFLK
jgi:hypothetical protein